MSDLENYKAEIIAYTSDLVITKSIIRILIIILVQYIMLVQNLTQAI